MMRDGVDGARDWGSEEVGRMKNNGVTDDGSLECHS